jgi:hypothetical protein
MRLWLWDTATHHGVTDDECVAMDRAAQCLGDGGTARVELAFLSASLDRLSNDHVRTGIGWTGTYATGIVQWVPLPVAREWPPAGAS